jgi:hypothetical protein
MLSKFSSDIGSDQMETCRLYNAVNVLLSLQAWNYFTLHYTSRSTIRKVQGS